MKCENCGNEEVNFHFTSNINGNTTEKHLCAECAGKLGYTEANQERPEPTFEDIFTELFGGRPNRRVFGGYSMIIPTFVIPTVGLIVTEEQSARQESPAQNEATSQQQTEQQQNVVPAELVAEIDEEMKRRREINVLREQMNAAVRTEDFEKAAALRDSIRSLEGSK